MSGSRRALAYNEQIEALRPTEYPMLKDAVYLDHAGTTLYAKSLVDKFAADMTTNLLGNPHAASGSSQMSTSRVDDIRAAALQFFNADPAEFDLVFLANATAAIKLVSDACRAIPGGFNYVYHQASHTSLIGVREEAVYSRSVNNDAVAGWVQGTSPLEGGSSLPGTTLFAYPAQSNMDGRRCPLAWPQQLRAQASRQVGELYTLLDAAALVGTSPLNLGDPEHAPDFTALSFYKIFGFPDLGGLIVRRRAAHLLQGRRYFGGGTVDTVVCVKEQWHAPKTHAIHETLEDGTLPVHSILALGSALGIHRALFGSMEKIASHTSFLADKLHAGLMALRHCNSRPVCVLYSGSQESRSPMEDNGPVVAFNLQNHLGAWVSLTEFEKLANSKGFHVRTGGVCNPGGIASALGLEPWEIKRNFSAGYRCGSEDDIVAGKPTGVIRASLGAMSTLSDVDRFVAFIAEFYTIESLEGLLPAVPSTRTANSLKVESMMVYPIKSCGGFKIPKDTAWEVRPEGLAWDREWCLVHQGTGQALSQKRHPRMALIRPSIDFGRGHLRITYQGEQRSEPAARELWVPLSTRPGLFRQALGFRNAASRVCGEDILAQAYVSPKINDFFSEILGVPCVLARFPPGGLGKSMRHAKAHLQEHQKTERPAARSPAVDGAEGVVTPPDSDTEAEKRRILLSNESPILAISQASLEALNGEIRSKGGKAISVETFRANIVVGSAAAEPREGLPAYAEDYWSRVRVGGQQFEALGSCRRCHMVCIDQETAEKSEEPFVTLAKTRRFHGKVYFGIHMCHVSAVGAAEGDPRQTHQCPTVQVGDEVWPE